VSNMKEKTVKRKYRRYDESFKKNAVKLLEDGRSISDVSMSLGINPQNLYEWRKRYSKSASISREENKYENSKKEIKELEKKLKRTEQERDILKKALSIFSRET